MLGAVDIAVVVGWLLLTLGAGVWFSRRASASTEDFFVSGRSLPWWAVGTSMVATTFAADTPLAVSGWVASEGIAENWVWWTFGLSGSVGVFLFARLWRRAEVITDAELVEIRYGGKLAPPLRSLKAVWFGVLFNVLVMAWVMKAMTKILGVVLGWPPEATLAQVAGASGALGDVRADILVVLGLFVLTVVYTAASGLWGVIATDLVQFGIAMLGSVALAVLAWNAVGGLEGAREGFATHGFDWDRTTALIPGSDPTGYDLGFATVALDGDLLGFVALIFVVWWGQQNIEGGGYLAQRLFAAKDDRHALLAYLWFTVAHVVVRPWPWLLVGIAGMAMLGELDDPERYYPRLMVDLLPPGLFGMMVASFLAAFMSTIDTHLNWGSSLLVNDVLKRWVTDDDAVLLRASRGLIVALAVLGAIASFLIDDIGGAWKLALSVTAGLGTVYIARWYWWRTSAWSEVAAMLFAAVATLVFAVLEPLHPANDGSAAWLAAVPAGWLAFPFSTALTTLLSIPVWVGVTLLTPACDRAQLEGFYARVRPGGPGWLAIAPTALQDGPSAGTFLGIGAGVATVYGSLLGAGWLLLGHVTWGVGALAIGAAGLAMMGWRISRERGFTSAPPG